MFLRRGFQLFLISLSISAFAEKMDLSNHNLVIQKLEGAIQSLSNDHVDLVPSMGRLADLYSERARIVAMARVEGSCDSSCPSEAKDREKAIAIYKKILSRALDKGMTLVQMAHLYQLNDQSQKAIQLYQQILSGKYSDYMKSLAHIGLADIYFLQTKYNQAIIDYRKAAASKATLAYGYVNYRIAWCLLNIGQPDKAVATIKKILITPEWLVRSSSQGRVYDASFHQDLAKDLVSFLTRIKTTSFDVKSVYDLSPADHKTENVLFLATEAHRVGQLTTALTALKLYSEIETDAQAKLQTLIRVAQVNFDMGNEEAALVEFRNATNLWRQMGCQKNCEEQKDQMRKIVLDWNRDSKKKPSPNLLKAYTLFAELFSDDIDMHYWAAQVAYRLENYPKAIQFYRNASEKSAEHANKNKNDQKYNNIFNGSLLGEIEAAEKLASYDARTSAYENYLRLNSKGEKSDEAKYQIAHVMYEQKMYQKASEAFHDLALDKEIRKDLRLKSADLALDSLAVLKNNILIEKWTREFMSHFSERKKEFAQISRQASMALVAETINQKNSDKSDLEEAYQRSQNIIMSGSSADEASKVNYNQLLLSEKLQNLEQMDRALDNLLRKSILVKSGSGTALDREQILAKKVWIREMRLDFTGAYQISRKMTFPQFTAKEKALRLATLAELAGQPSRVHFNEYLKYESNIDKGNRLRSELVVKSDNPWQELDRQTKYLVKTPDLLSKTTLEVYARRANTSRAKAYIQKYSLDRFSSGRTLKRLLSYGDIFQSKALLARHRLNAYTDSKLKSSLQQRLNLLDRMRMHTKSSIRQNDWILQVHTSHVLANEYERLYQDVLRLPIPRKLSSKERNQYESLLKLRAKPFLMQSQFFAKSEDKLWQNNQFLRKFLSEWPNLSKGQRRLALRELDDLASIAPNEDRNAILNVTQSSDSFPSDKELTQARAALRSEPFDADKVKRLRDIEIRRSQPAMVAYLDTRLEQLKRRQ